MLISIELVEVIISSPSTGSWSSPSSGMDVPQPASPTFTAVLAGFCDSEDVEMASVWFNRLLEQHSPGNDPLTQGQVVRPDTMAWNIMIKSLASHGMVDNLNNIFEQMLTVGAKDGISPTVMQKVITFVANMKRMQGLASSDSELKLKFLLDKVMVINDDVGKRSVMVQAIWEESLSHGLVDLGTKAVLDYAETLVNLVRQGATTSLLFLLCASQMNILSRSWPGSTKQLEATFPLLSSLAYLGLLGTSSTTDFSICKTHHRNRIQRKTRARSRGLKRPTLDHMQMQTMHRMEMAADRLYKTKMIRGFCHLAIGQEAVSVGLEHNVIPSPLCVAAPSLGGLLGRQNRMSKGKGCSMHIFTPTFFGGNDIVGAQVPLTEWTSSLSVYAREWSSHHGIVIYRYGGHSSQLDEEAKAEVDAVVEASKTSSFPTGEDLWTNIYQKGTKPREIVSTRSTKPYARSPGPTPSDARALTFPFPLAQPRRSTPSSDQTPYSPSYSGLSHSDFLNPYTQSSTVAPHLNSYDATADSLSQQHGDLLHMRIEDLLWIPSVERMFAAYNELKDHCVDLSSTIASVTKTQTKMYDDVALLRLQLEEARWQVPPPTSGYYANMNCKRSPNLLDHRATAATRFGNSSERPEQFPAAILWTFADAKKDSAVGITLTNPNRPNLKQIIRTADGSVADDAIYSTVRSSAHNVAATLLAPLDSKRPELKGAIGRKSPGTKSFYKNYFKDQWMAALEHLEGLQPLLGLCAEHWKAEAVLQSVLTSLHPKKGNNSLPVDEPNGSSEEEEAGNGQLEGKRSCVLPSVSRSPKRNRRMSVTRPAAADSTTAKSNRIKTFTPTVALKAKSTHRSKPTGVPQTPSASNPTRAPPRPRPKTAVGTAGLDTSTTGLDTTGLNTTSLGATSLGTTGLGTTGLGTTGLGVTGLGTTDSGTTGLDATGLGATGMDETGMDETGDAHYGVLR
ncbi:hypothetical protein JOM56_010941 [Amanita muscaria]